MSRLAVVLLLLTAPAAAQPAEGSFEPAEPTSDAAPVVSESEPAIAEPPSVPASTETETESAVAGAPVLAPTSAPDPAPAEPAPDAPEDVTIADAPAPPPPWRPYSIPWNLRPLPSVNVVRFDQSLGFHDRYGPAASGLDASFAQLLTVGFRSEDWLQFVMRGGWTYQDSDHAAAASTLLFGMNVATLLTPDIRFNVFAAGTCSLGTAAGPLVRGARLVRAAMDNAMFLPNYAAGILGFAVAWVDQGWTVHGEATLFLLGRMLSGAPDEAIVNSTFGLHVGYFVLRELTVSGELHHQQLLSSPAVLSTTRPADYGEDLRSQSSATVGLRGHIHIAGSVWVRPGLAYTVGLDDPLWSDLWQILQADVPLFF